MTSTEQKSTLTDMLVRDAMRSQIVSLHREDPIRRSIAHLIKYKINALLIVDGDDLPIGVVSKTDVVGAYYAGLPLDSPLEHIMVSPPLFCDADDTLESALDLMKSMGIYRLYILDPHTGRATGVLAYPDIVGILYQYCRACDRSLLERRRKSDSSDDVPRFRVSDVMTPYVMGFRENQPLTEILEGLSAYRFGAVLIRDISGAPTSVVSKTDLVRAYARGVPVDAEARTILASSRVYSCDEEDYVEDAIRQMILTDVHRFFVHRDDPSHIIGVFSLSNAARVRSGSCHACVTSRIRVEDGA